MKLATQRLRISACSIEKLKLLTINFHFELFMSFERIKMN